MVTENPHFSIVLVLTIFVGLGIHSPRPQAAGYVSRPCGLDLNRNGVISEPGINDIIARGPTGRQGFSAADSKRWDYDNVVREIKVLNNMIMIGGTNSVGIVINSGNLSADDPDPIVIAGNTVYRTNTSSVGNAYAVGTTLAPFLRNNIIFKNNIAAQDASNGSSINVRYAPTRWDADGNTYGVDTGYRWNNIDQTSFAV